MKNETKSKVIIAVIGVIIIGGCATFAYQNFTKTKPVTNQEIVEIAHNNELYNNPQIKNFVSKKPVILNKIEITEVKNCEPQLHENACITVKNLTDKKMSNMMVTVDLYDKNGNVIIDSGDTLKKLAPKSEYTFKMPIIRENAVSWELTSIEELGENF